MMKRLTGIVIFLFFSLYGLTQSVNKNKYSGGMLILQPGYTITENLHQEINDLSFGIGGILRFYFYEHLTAGIYGGTLRTKYKSTKSENSYISLGYGGPFIGITRKTNKFRYTFSAFIGKGTVRNLHIESQNINTLTDAYLYKNSAVVFSPILSLDYSMSQRLLLTLQTVCLTTKTDNDKTLYNPTFQIGILFNR